MSPTAGRRAKKESSDIQEEFIESIQQLQSPLTQKTNRRSKTLAAPPLTIDTPVIKQDSLSEIPELKETIPESPSKPKRKEKFKFECVANGFDLSFMLKDMLPRSQLVEPDEFWDWDILFAQIAIEVKKSTFKVDPLKQAYMKSDRKVVRQ